MSCAALELLDKVYLASPRGAASSWHELMQHAQHMAEWLRPPLRGNQSRRRSTTRWGRRSSFVAARRRGSPCAVPFHRTACGSQRQGRSRRLKPRVLRREPLLELRVQPHQGAVGGSQEERQKRHGSSFVDKPRPVGSTCGDVDVWCVTYLQFSRPRRSPQRG